MLSMITAIEAQRRAGRFNIFVDGEFVIGVADNVVAALGLRVGTEMTAERLAEVAYAEEKRRALENAARLLESRVRSSREVKDRLTQKGYEEALIADVIATLTDSGYLNDAEFAAQWVESRSRSRPGGVRKLRSELFTKGVAREQIDDAVAGVTEDDEVELAIAALAKKVRKLPEDMEARLEERQSLAGFLQRRGFGWAVVKRALASVFDE